MFVMRSNVPRGAVAVAGNLETSPAALTWGCRENQGHVASGHAPCHALHRQTRAYQESLLHCSHVAGSVPPDVNDLSRDHEILGAHTWGSR